MLHNDEHRLISSEDVFIDFGERVRNGYDPGRVERHLRTLSDGIVGLRELIDNGGLESESVELVLKATRRSVDEALGEARDRASGIVSDALAEAEGIRKNARQKAARRQSAAESELERVATRQDALSQGITTLESEIETRKSALLDASVQLANLAAALTPTADDSLSVINLRTPETPQTMVVKVDATDSASS